MLIYDLKLVLFVLLCLLLLIVWGVWRIANKRIQLKDDDLSAWQTFPLGVIFLTPSHRPRFVNRKAQQLLHAETADDRPTGLDHLLQKIGRDERVQRFTLLIEAERSLDVWVGPFGTGRLVLVQDLSAKRQQELDTHLYWSSVSHELRTPLTSILSHLELSRAASVPDEVRRHSLEIVHQQTERLNNLVRGTLDLGRMKALTQFDKMRVDLVLVVEGAIADLILLAEQQEIGIDFSCQPAIPPILGHPDKLKQVFINLLDNGIKYSPKGGTITVSIEAVADGVCCQIVDRGMGIPAEHLSKLTQQFYRVQRELPGSGLGLAIVDEIVRQHDGLLHIESRTAGEDRGTTFTVTLPMVPTGGAT